MRFRRLAKSLITVAIFAALFVAGTFVFKARRVEINSLPKNKIVEPRAKAFSDYAGSTSCRSCHEEQFADWAKSNHALAERPINLQTDRAAFQSTQPMGDDLPETSVGIVDGKPFVAAIGLSGRRETNFIERVIGNDPLQQFLIAAPGGRWQPLEASWDIHRHEWFNSFGHEQRQPGEWGHWTGRGMNWNSQCAACHNTRLQKNYDEATDSYRTAMAEQTVGCEACHGPLQAHNDWQKQFGQSGKSDPTLHKFSREQTLDNCGQCHSRRAELTDDFKPGDAFQDHFDLDTVDGSDVYFPDGQVLEEDFEFAAFLGSRMHTAGISCNNCHQPHTGKVRLPGNFLCLQCHGFGNTNAPVIDPVAHSHHQVRGYTSDGKLIESDLSKFTAKDFPQTGGECVNCHMPQTVYMQRHKRHDHGFTIPDPLLTKQFGIPNACNRCHQDRSADWALEAAEKWYGSRMERPSRHRAQVFAQARSGDEAAIQPLLQLLEGNELPYWKASAISLLEPWTDVPPVQRALLANLNHSNALVRTKAVRALEPLLEAETNMPVESALREKLNDNVRSVRLAAAWALRANLELTNSAAQELKHQLDHLSDQPAGQLQKGVFFAARNELPQALEHIRKASAWDTNSAPIHYQLALAYHTAQQSSNALAEFRAAVQLEPNEPDYHRALALALRDSGDAKAATKELETAKRLQDAQSKR